MRSALIDAKVSEIEEELKEEKKEEKGL